MRDRAILALIGGQGMGKTVLLKYFVWQWHQQQYQHGPILVVDGSFNYRKYGQDFWADAPSDDPRDNGRMVNSAVRQMLYFRRYMAMGFLVIDDYDGTFKKQNPDIQVLREFQTKPRHAFGDAAIAFRTLNACPSELETAISYFYVFRTNHDNSIKRIAGMCGRPELVEMEKQLQPLQAIRVYMKNMTVKPTVIDLQKEILPSVVAWEKQADAGQISWPVISASAWYKNRANNQLSQKKP